MSKRLRAVLIGCGFTVVYGLWSAAITGGGHGNFIWLLMFIFVEFFGLYFPVMGALAVDLTSRTIRIVFASLLLFNLHASAVLRVGWMTEVEDGGRTEYSRILEVSGLGFVIFCIIIHFLPTIVLSAFLFRSLAVADASNEKESLGLGLS